MPHLSPDYIAFNGGKRIASGTLADVARKVKTVHDANPAARLLVFDARTSARVELDLRGKVADVLARLPVVAAPPVPSGDAPDDAPPSPAGPGRPKLGVVAREVTLLPRHWDWLKSQPGGASVALRKLVEQARRDNAAADRARQATDAAYQFMTVMAGDRAGFEEATRALFAADGPRFEALIAGWPADIRTHLRRLATAAFQAKTQA